MPRDFKTILCPTDFSEESYHALEYAVRFAKLSGATILVPHIIHIPTEHLRDDDGHVLPFERLKSRARTLLEEARDQHAGGYAKCELLLDIGDPFELLLGIAQQRQVDLVVISTHGRTGVEHLVMGSVAEKLIRHAPCPVFVVRRGAA